MEVCYVISRTGLVRMDMPDRAAFPAALPSTRLKHDMEFMSAVTHSKQCERFPQPNHNRCNLGKADALHITIDKASAVPFLKHTLWRLFLSRCIMYVVNDKHATWKRSLATCRVLFWAPWGVLEPGADLPGSDIRRSEVGTTERRLAF